MQISLVHEGVPYTNFDKEELLEAGVPQAVIDQFCDAEIAREAITEIDAFMDSIFTTSTSQASRYQQKFDEAIRYRDAGFPNSVANGDYPFIVTEAGARGITKRAQAELILAAAAGFQQAGAAAESARVGINAAISATGSHEEKRERVTQIINQLRAGILAALGQ